MFRNLLIVNVMLALCVPHLAAQKNDDKQATATATAALELARDMMNRRQDGGKGASSEDLLVMEEAFKDWETRIFPVKHVNLGSLRTLLTAFRAIVRQDDRLSALAVRAPKEIMPAIADTIARFDVPQASEAHDVQLVGYILSTSKLRELPMPTDLQKQIDQFKNILAFSDYYLIESFVLRSSDGGIPRISGNLPVAGDNVYSLKYELRSNLKVEITDSGSVVRLNNLELKVRFPFNSGGNWNFEDGILQTAISIPAGKTVVVGKSAFRDQALLLVLKAELLK